MAGDNKEELKPASGGIDISEGDGYGINELYTSEYYTKLGTLGKILIPNGLINDRVHRIADIIRKDYPGQTVHLLCILKGSISYFNDLMGWLRSVNSCCVVGNAPFTYDFIRVSSYNGMDSVGLENVKLEGGFGHLNNLKDRHVVVVEDLIDTGNTMEALIPLLQSYGPASLKISALLMKNKCREKSSYVDLLKYVGFCIPDEFVVGYGMDCKDNYRDLEHIYTLNDYGKLLYKSP
eukprot:281895_1